MGALAGSLAVGRARVVLKESTKEPASWPLISIRFNFSLAV